MDYINLESLEVQVKQFLDKCSEIKNKFLSLPDKEESSEAPLPLRQEPND